MSTESHNSAHNAGALPEHDTVAFENRDVKPRTIYVYLAVLALSVVLSYVVCVFIDRKSTRLNSSHTVISYAVFCLKKKKQKFIMQPISELNYGVSVAVIATQFGSING